VTVGFEQADQAVAEEKEVFGYDKSHGTVKLTPVGPPVGLSVSTCPSKAASRRAMPASPEPGEAVAPPVPLSETTIETTPRRCDSSMAAWVA
jgi:hypothetical protein